mmetsp:Transcript_37883/g.55819  ORF Transcript_37883/g.55819 Transcript_37883/m.55819 type:complete len:235 (+) Transcript_37883:149-853(+)|eukprot:CAMPEP_0195530998 /NCGR_PEP_ID=MMETSP0794_2-20130614/34111_1 /TAXON_ID=515487 /ORGANISM="Stephanopyxis turris, Strain CCMP 815" /LENGTH=234 /DNA_ID=CAMNT_0040662627 /DNA_START=116 /DNA_END=820 /DNA_ORIENTATION=-
MCLFRLLISVAVFQSVSKIILTDAFTFIPSSEFTTKRSPTNKIRYISSPFCEDNANRVATKLHESSSQTESNENEDTLENDDIARTLARAKELIAKSEAKLKEQIDKEAIDPDTNTDNAPTSKSSNVDDKVIEKRSKVTKSTNEESGLITTDGEMMAQISEEEEWEARSLLELFEDELEGMLEGDDDDDAPAKPKKKRKVDKGAAMSIYGLKKVLQTEDFDKVFNKRNYLIGEE